MLAALGWFGQIAGALVFPVCIAFVGPALARRIFPNQTGFVGNALAGRSGMLSFLWGVPLGLLLATAILTALNPPQVYSSALDFAENSLLLLAIITVLSLPLLLWGASSWAWDASGLRFRGVLKRRSFAWSQIVRVAQSRDGSVAIWSEEGERLSIPPFVAGARAIIAALWHYRQSAFDQAKSSAGTVS